MRILFYVMRHGEKDSNPDNTKALLTKNGEEQVKKSAINNLLGINFSLVCSSDIERAKQTAQIVATEIAIKEDVIQFSEFGFQGAPDLDKFKEHAKQVDSIKKQDRPTVADWEKISPNFIQYVRKNFEAGIIKVASSMSGKPGSTHNVFVASHSPTGETASPTPDSTLTLREADIVMYTVEAKDGNAEIISCQNIDRGF